MGTRVPGPGLNSSELDDFTLDTGTLVEIVLQTAINGRQLTGTPTSNSHQVILHGVEEIRRNNRAEFESMCSRLEFSSANIYLSVQQIFEGIFDDNINWGRIGVLLAFGGHLAQHCLMNGMGEVVESLTPWMVAFICTRLQEWILEHGGWVGIGVALCCKTGHFYRYKFCYKFLPRALQEILIVASTRLHLPCLLTWTWFFLQQKP